MCRWKDLSETQQIWISFFISGIAIFILVMAIADNLRNHSKDLLPISIDCSFKTKDNVNQTDFIRCKIDRDRQLMAAMPEITVPLDKLYKLDMFLILVLWPLLLIFHKSSKKIINRYI